MSIHYLSSAFKSTIEELEFGLLAPTLSLLRFCLLLVVPLQGCFVRREAAVCSEPSGGCSEGGSSFSPLCLWVAASTSSMKYFQKRNFCLNRTEGSE